MYILEKYIYRTQSAQKLMNQIQSWLYMCTVYAYTTHSCMMYTYILVLDSGVVMYSTENSPLDIKFREDCLML